MTQPLSALTSLAKNPVPGGAIAGFFPSYDGSALRYARWDATRGPRRGTVCIFQGRGEYIEKYFETIADLRRRGFAVAIMDWRGQGGSQRALKNPRKGHIISFSEYDRDLVRFMKDIVLPDCPPPYIALGHSMGGTILLRHATEPGSWFERVILTAPMLAFNDAKVGFPQSLARLYAELSSATGFSTAYVLGGSDSAEEKVPFERSLLTSDHERWSRNRSVLDAAPELGLGSPTIGWLRAAYRAMRRLSDPECPRAIKVPCLFFAAGNDKIVSSPAIEDFAVRVKIGMHILMPGSRHEILQEADPIRQRFWAAFDSYLGVESRAA